MLEILIVVIVVGVIATLTTLSIQGEDPAQKVERETRKLAAQISLLQDEALVQSREFGIALWQNGYRFWSWSPDSGWLPLVGDDNFKAHLTIDDLEISLSLLGQPVALEQVPANGFPTVKPAAADNSSGTTPTAPDFRLNLPPIVLFSSGEASAFEATLAHPESQLRWSINGDIVGTLKIASEVVQ